MAQDDPPQLPAFRPRSWFPASSTNDGRYASVPAPSEPQPKSAPAPPRLTARDYRGRRASQENKKFVNVLVDAELRDDVKLHMILERLSWETLVDQLLREWVRTRPPLKTPPAK